jgi:PAS domain S-box-containing protein
MERDDRDWRKAYEELEVRFRKRMEELTALAEDLRTEIRQRVQAENDLLEAGHALRGIIDASPLAIIAGDPEGKVTLWNPAAERIFGWSEGEVLGRFNPTVPEEEADAFRVFLSRALAGETFANVGGRRRRKDGTLLDTLLSTAPLRDATGHVVGHVIILADITERKRTESALRASEERFRSLLQNLPVGVSVARRGRLIFLNSEQRMLFGTNALSIDIRDFPGIHPDDRERLLTLCDETRPGDAWREEAEIRIRPEDRTETERTVICRAAPTLYDGDKVVLISMGDITRVKELERVAAVQDRMAVLGQVAAGIAHELRNPLSGLNLYISSVERILAHAESVEPDVREQAASALDMMKSASARIAGVIRRVMDFIRPVPPRLTLVDLNPAVREAVQLSAAMLRRSGIRTETRIDENLPRCYADIPSIEQVLLNLIANAAQALEAKEGDRTIAVTSGVENGNVVIAVADSGPGVPEGLRDKVFEPFFTTKTDGTGIGLVLCTRIVEKHAGSIDVGTSRLGGAEFRIRIPAGDKRKEPRET